MTQRDTLIAWLNEAYGTEQELVTIFEQRMSDAVDDPELQSAYQSHLDETHQHVTHVEECIRQLGGDPSGTKAVLGKLAGYFTGVSTGLHDDELIRSVQTAYSLEHYEIACYRTIVAGAELLGETEVLTTCSRILLDEERMAAWLDQYLPTLVRTYLGEHPGVPMSHDIEPGDTY